MFHCERLAKACVVSPASVDPGSGGNLQIRFGYPDGARNGQFGQRLVGLDDVDLVDDETEAISHVDQRSHNRGPTWRRKNQANRIGLASNAQRMDLEGRLVRSDRRADFEHVRAEDLGSSTEVVGVV